MSGIHIRDHNDPDDNAIVVAELNFGGPERLPGRWARFLKKKNFLTNSRHLPMPLLALLLLVLPPTPMPAPAAALGHASAQDIVQEERNTEKKAEANDSDPAAG